MFHPAKPLLKPLNCNQVWENMLTTDGGRICQGCGKLVVDFRKYNWYEIELAQRESIVPVCGMYCTQQIDNWGIDISPPATGGSWIKVSAALLALVQLAPISLKAQSKAPQQQQVPSPQKSAQKPVQKQPALKRIISGTVIVQTSDTTRYPLANAVVSTFGGWEYIKTTTDSVGRFTLDLTGIYKKLRDTFEIEVVHPQHMRKTVQVARRNLKPAENNVIDIVLKDFTIEVKKPEIRYDTTYTTGTVITTNFYVTSIPIQPVKPKNKIKTWWHRVTKKKDN
jgi:hypothetical protein